jgi:hypothetical protein
MVPVAAFKVAAFTASALLAVGDRRHFNSLAYTGEIAARQEMTQAFPLRCPYGEIAAPQEMTQARATGEFNSIHTHEHARVSYISSS